MTDRRTDKLKPEMINIISSRFIIYILIRLAISTFCVIVGFRFRTEWWMNRKVNLQPPPHSWSRPVGELKIIEIINVQSFKKKDEEDLYSSCI
jgi:hypothetical protein